MKPSEEVRKGITWLGRIRLKALAYFVGIALAVLATLSAPAWISIPVFGVAVAALTFTISKLGHRLTEGRCWTCGHPISLDDAGEHGIACPECGTLQDSDMRLADAPEPTAADEDEPVGRA